MLPKTVPALHVSGGLARVFRKSLSCGASAAVSAARATEEELKCERSGRELRQTRYDDIYFYLTQKAQMFHEKSACAAERSRSGGVGFTRRAFCQSCIF